MTTPTLTKTRQAVWAAIDNRSGLREGDKSVFRKQIRFEDRQPLIEGDSVEEMLGIGDLPALAIWLQDVQMRWRRNTDQEWTANLLIQMWTPHHDLNLAERYAEQVALAIHEQTKANSTVTFVKDAAGRYPEGAGNMNFEPTLIGRTEDGGGANKAVRTSFNIRIPMFQSVN